MAMVTQRIRARAKTTTLASSFTAHCPSALLSSTLSHYLVKVCLSPRGLLLLPWDKCPKMLPGTGVMGNPYKGNLVSHLELFAFFGYFVLP